MLLFANLDLKPLHPILHPILWRDLHLEGVGRPVEYNPQCDLRALMLRQLKQIPYVKDLVERLNRSQSMRLACGYQSKVPTEAHFSQMKKRIGVEGFRVIEEWLLHEACALRLRESQPLSAVGLIQAACFDGTNLPGWSSRDPNDTCKGRADHSARLTGSDIWNRSAPAETSFTGLVPAGANFYAVSA